MWMQIDDKQAEALLALASEGDSTPLRYFQDRVRHYRDEGNIDIEAKFREAAKEKSSDGELEVDEEATVSLGADGHGAYVMAWWWITNEEAGIETAEEE